MQRKGSTNASTTEIGQLVLKRELFLMSISIVVGHQKIRVNDRSIDLFGQLPGLRNRLRSRRATIQFKLLRFADPCWFGSAEDLPALRDEVTELIVTTNQLREELLGIYDSEYQRFLTRFDTRHAGRFPSREQVAQSFAVHLQGPILLSSLGFEVREAALSQSQQEALEELQSYWVQTVRESLKTAITEAKTDTYRLIEEILITVEQINNPKQLHSKTEKRLQNCRRQLRTAFQLAQTTISTTDSDLLNTFEGAKELVEMALAGENREKLSDRVQQIRELGASKKIT